MTASETIDRTDESHRTPSDEAPDADPAANRSVSLADIQDAYAQYADWIDRFGWLNRLMTGRHRRRQFGNARGRVLDVACGAGTNFRYLPASTELVGIDVSDAMVSLARAELEDLERDGTVERMDAQALAFEDESFDTVVSSFSTCTFPDQIAALQEMERVCRPGGRILLLEHGKSDVGPVARYQEWRADAHYERSGCRITQDPLAVVRRAGLSVESADSGRLGRVTRITCRVPERDDRGVRSDGETVQAEVNER